MTSPFPPSSSAPGKGHLIAEILPNGLTGLTVVTFQYPLKLISPSPTAGQKSVLVFIMTYGGGLVGGDQVHLSVEVSKQAKLTLVTQGHTKIFKSLNGNIVTRQHLDVTVKTGSSVCLLPDPVQPFQDSVYDQCQIFRVDCAGSLCFLDWVSAGRTARGENWDFYSWRGRNEVWSTQNGNKARLLLRDSVILERNSSVDEESSIREKMQNIGIFGTMILYGPLMEALAAFFMNEFASLPRLGARDFRFEDKTSDDNIYSLSKHELWRKSRLEQEKECGVFWSAAKIRGCTIIKFGACHVEGGRTWIASMVKEEGSVSKHFGDDSTMCIR